MRRLFSMIVLLFFLYFVYHVTFIYFQGGHNINYEIIDNDKVINVNEILYSSNKYDDDNYSLAITVDDITFNIQTFNNFHRFSYIIKDIKYYSDNESNCIFVKYRGNKILSDVLCMDDNIIYPYHSLANPSEGLQEFVSTLGNDGYDSNNWIDKITNTSINDNQVQSDNLQTDQYIGIASSNGFYRINSIDGIKYIKIYVEDMNDAKYFARGFVNGKFIVLNYDDQDLYRFYVENMTNNGEKIVSSDFTFSKNTFYLGSKNTSIYIYDPDVKKEYEVDYESSNVLEVGNEDTGILYYDEGKWQRMSIDGDIESISFGSEYANDYENSEYDKIIKIGHEYGYYYLIKKVDNRYNVYRTDITKKDSLMYLFTTSNIDTLVINGEYLYYIEDDTLKYYGDLTGNRTLLTNGTILQSDTVQISVYYDNIKR